MGACKKGPSRCQSRKPTGAFAQLLPAHEGAIVYRKVPLVDENPTVMVKATCKNNGISDWAVDCSSCL